MKRVIAAASNFNSQLTEYSTYQRGRQKFAIHENLPSDPNSWKASISEIHPYDEAEYTWARIGARGAMEAEFIRNGKVVDRMQLNYYDPDDYEDLEPYFNDIIDSICLELRQYNKDVTPKIDHT